MARLRQNGSEKRVAGELGIHAFWNVLAGAQGGTESGRFSSIGGLVARS